MKKCFTRILQQNRHFFTSVGRTQWQVPKYANDFDVDYLCDKSNFEEIYQNVKNRKGIGNIELIHEIKNELGHLEKDSEAFKSTQERLFLELRKIPNRTHPSVADYGEEPKIVKHIGEPKQLNFKPLEFHEISKKLNLMRTEQLGNLAGNRSYVFMGELAELEQALVHYTAAKLLKKNCRMISVPDMLPRDVIERCGMNTRGDRAQVYSLDPELHGEDICLSGTSEMALGGFFNNKTIPAEILPLRVAAVSRCYRAEVSSVAEEKGIYRVHQFTKVEIFYVCKPESSDSLLEEILKFQEEHFSSLGLHLRTLDMPPHELGAPAYRKYDIEAWLPGRGIFGEISSTSNCTDYQSRRLGIKYKENGVEKYAHTLNGTACAVPRLLIALFETNQNENGTVDIPEVLQKFMRFKKHIGRQKTVPELRLIKNKRH